MKNTKVLISRNPAYSACPACGKKGTLQRSRTNSMKEQIIRKTGFFKIYRCVECGWRGFKTSLAFTKNSYKNLLIYFVIIVVTAVVARYVLTHFMPV